MKKIYFVLALLTGALTLSACDNQPTVVAEDLLHHRFTLIKLDDQKVESQQAFIEFGENLRISGKMCNNFYGQSTLTEGVIKSAGFAMTKMACGHDNQLNQLDGIVDQLFMGGAKTQLTKDGKKTFLTLSDDIHKLQFELKDLM